MQEDNNFIISAPPKLKLKDLKTRVLIIGSPEHQILPDSAPRSSINFVLKTFEKKGLFSLTPKKSQLSLGNYYGIYTKEEINQPWELRRVFYIKYPEPVLVSHDVEEKVPKNRLKFSFKFNQAINILSDQTVELKALSMHAPKISSLRVNPDGNILIISREKEVNFVENERYFFVFNNLVNLDNQKIIIKPLEFVAGEVQENLKIIRPLALDIGSDSAEIRWYLNNNHEAELYFGEDLSGIYNCLGHNCPRMPPIVPQHERDLRISFLGTNLITGLKPKAAYYYILRAEDHQGQVLLFSGLIKTRADLSLRFSEILVNPKKPEHKAEFIELFYAGLSPMKFENFKLIFTNSEAQSQTCILASSDNILYVHPEDYILVVGHDFDEKNFLVPKEARIIRLVKKSLCGGLPNKEPSFIKLVDNKGIVDHYGAYLWQSPEAVSVVRRDVRGLDEFDNYCYSDAVRGPTPGGPN